MDALTAELQRALAQRERDGVAGPPAGRALLAGADWPVEDGVCKRGLGGLVVRCGARAA